MIVFPLDPTILVPSTLAHFCPPPHLAALPSNWWEPPHTILPTTLPFRQHASLSNNQGRHPYTFHSYQTHSCRGYTLENSAGGSLLTPVRVPKGSLPSNFESGYKELLRGWLSLEGSSIQDLVYQRINIRISYQWPGQSNGFCVLNFTSPELEADFSNIEDTPVPHWREDYKGYLVTEPDPMTSPVPSPFNLHKSINSAFIHNSGMAATTASDECKRTP